MQRDLSGNNFSFIATQETSQLNVNKWLQGMEYSEVKCCLYLKRITII